MSWWFIYLITRLDEINLILGFSLVLLVVFTVIWFFLRVMPEVFRHSEDHETERKENNGYTLGEKHIILVARKMNVIPIMLIISIVLSVLTPTMKEAVAIYLIPKMINNEAVQEIPRDTVKLLQLKLDEWINDLSPGKDVSKD